MTKPSTGLLVFMAVFLIVSAGIAGCTTSTSQPPPAASGVPVQKLSTASPAEMALQPSEVPGNFTLLEKGERNVSEMRGWALDHGWKAGYYTDYQKNDGISPSGAIIEQVISVYPAENITLIVPDTVSLVKNWSAEDPGNVTVEELSIPAIGDSSTVLKVSDKRENSPWYMIALVKDDVYEQFYTNGTAADYETLRHLAGVAVAKIR
jgi:hypothetical protein